MSPLLDQLEDPPPFWADAAGFGEGVGWEYDDYEPDWDELEQLRESTEEYLVEKAYLKAEAAAADAGLSLTPSQLDALMRSLLDGGEDWEADFEQGVPHPYVVFKRDPAMMVTVFARPRNDAVPGARASRVGYQLPRRGRSRRTGRRRASARSPADREPSPPPPPPRPRRPAKPAPRRHRTNPGAG